MSTTKQEPITLFDIPSKDVSDPAWNMHVWKTRLTLNYKGIPYKTSWISYPEIKSTLSTLGFKPMGVEYDGGSLYTVPAIINQADPISDSAEIASYLDEAYPDTPKVFPDGTKQAQLDFVTFAFDRVWIPALLLTMPGVPGILKDPKGAKYFSRMSEFRWGRPLKEFCPEGSDERQTTWKKLRYGMDSIAAVYNRNVDSGGEYFVGNSITFADMAMVALFLYLKAVPADRDGKEVANIWQVVETWNDGKWKRLMDRFVDCLEVY